MYKIPCHEERDRLRDTLQGDHGGYTIYFVDFDLVVLFLNLTNSAWAG